MPDIKVGDWIKWPGRAGALVAEVEEVNGATVVVSLAANGRWNVRTDAIGEVRAPAPEPCVWTQHPNWWASTCGCMKRDDPKWWMYCPHCGHSIHIAPPRPK